MATALDIDRVKAPLVIGVTGHRDLREEDREHLKNSVRKVFTELRKQYPSTPFVLLSPLAEGADRRPPEQGRLKIAPALTFPLLPHPNTARDNPHSGRASPAVSVESDLSAGLRFRRTGEEVLREDLWQPRGIQSSCRDGRRRAGARNTQEQDLADRGLR